MRRALFVLVALGALAAAVLVQPAGACHFGSAVPGQCPNPPEAQPFDPVPFVTLADSRYSAHSNVDLGWDQAEHEQFPEKLRLEVHKDFVFDLNLPNQNEEVADLDIHAIVNGAAVDEDGEILDNNDGANWPSNGVYRWKVLIHPAVGGDIACDLFVDRNAADGHLHLKFDACQALIDHAKDVDASVLKFTAKFDATLAGGAWLTNPATPGTYANTTSFIGYDDPGTPQTPPTVTKTVNVQITNRKPTSVNVTPATARRKTGESYTATALVKDQQGDPIQNASVDFEVTSATAHQGMKCADVATGADGNASCTYTETTSSANETLTATATNFGDSKSGTATVDWDKATTLDLAPATATKTVTRSHTVTATLKDDDGQAMQGESVIFNVTAGPDSGDSGSGTTNASGQATFTVTGDSGTGTDTIKASSSGLEATGTVQWVAPDVALAPATDTRTVSQTHIVTATVTDTAGAAMSGLSVHFEVTSGPNAGRSADRTTDGAGKASFSYTGDAGTGTDTIRASTNGGSKTATVQWVRPTLALAPETATRTVGQSQTLTATATDNGGAAMQGVAVHFEVTAGPNHGKKADTATNAQGKADFTYAGDGGEGTDTVEASALDASDTSTVRWDRVPALVPTTIDLTHTHHGNTSDYMSDSYDQTPDDLLVRPEFVALVKDQHGDPLRGVEVRFSIPDGPTAGKLVRTLVTGSDGKAIFRYNAIRPNGEGRDDIEARVVGTQLADTYDNYRWDTWTCDPEESDATIHEVIHTGLSNSTQSSDQEFNIGTTHVEVSICITE